MGDSVSSRKSEILSQIFHHVIHDIISGENEKMFNSITSFLASGPVEDDDLW